MRIDVNLLLFRMIKLKSDNIIKKFPKIIDLQINFKFLIGRWIKYVPV